MIALWVILWAVCVGTLAFIAQSVQLTTNTNQDQPSYEPDGFFLISTMDGQLHALDSLSGTPMWSVCPDGPLISATLGTSGILPGVDGDLYSLSNFELTKLPFSVSEWVKRCPAAGPNNTQYHGTHEAVTLAVDKITGKVLHAPTQFTPRPTKPRAPSPSPTIRSPTESSSRTLPPSPVVQEYNPLWLALTRYQGWAVDTRTGEEQWRWSVTEYGNLRTPETLFPAPAIDRCTSGSKFFSICTPHSQAIPEKPADDWEVVVDNGKVMLTSRKMKTQLWQTDLIPLVEDNASDHERGSESSPDNSAHGSSAHGSSDRLDLHHPSSDSFKIDSSSADSNKSSEQEAELRSSTGSEELRSSTGSEAGRRDTAVSTVHFVPSDGSGLVRVFHFHILPDPDARDFPPSVPVLRALPAPQAKPNQHALEARQQAEREKTKQSKVNTQEKQRQKEWCLANFSAFFMSELCPLGADGGGEVEEWAAQQSKGNYVVLRLPAAAVAVMVGVAVLVLSALAKHLAHSALFSASRGISLQGGTLRVGKLTVQLHRVLARSERTTVFRGNFEHRPVAVVRITNPRRKREAAESGGMCGRSASSRALDKLIGGAAAQPAGAQDVGPTCCWAHKQHVALLAADSHPNILRYIAKEETDEWIYLALEECMGNISQAAEIWRSWTPPRVARRGPSFNCRRRNNNSTSRDRSSTEDEADQGPAGSPTRQAQSGNNPNSRLALRARLGDRQSQTLSLSWRTLSEIEKESAPPSTKTAMVLRFLATVISSLNRVREEAQRRAGTVPNVSSGGSSSKGNEKEVEAKKRPKHDPTNASPSLRATLGKPSVAQRKPPAPRLPHDKAVTIAAQILRGVDHLHSKDLVHGALHPGNILIADDLTVKLADMGGRWGLHCTPTSQHGAYHRRRRAGEIESDGEEVELDPLKADDIRQTGLVLSYLFSKSQPQVGNVSILDPEEQQKGVETAPLWSELVHKCDVRELQSVEVRDLVLWMIAPPSTRPLASECLLHPLLWSPETRLAFVQECSDFLAVIAKRPRHSHDQSGACVFLKHSRSGDNVHLKRTRSTDNVNKISRNNSKNNLNESSAPTTSNHSGGGIHTTDKEGSNNSDSSTQSLSNGNSSKNSNSSSGSNNSNSSSGSNNSNSDSGSSSAGGEGGSGRVRKGRRDGRGDGDGRANCCSEPGPTHPALRAVDMTPLTVIARPWNEVVGEEVWQLITADKGQATRPYDTSSPLHLLRFIRNKTRHAGDMPKELQRALGSNATDVWSFFEVRFPRLVLHLYKACSLALPDIHASPPVSSPLARYYNGLPLRRLEELRAAAIYLPPADLWADGF